MKTTIWGTASKIGEVAREDWPSGRLRSWHSFNDIEPELPAAGVMVDTDHNHERLGEVVYGEISEDGRLNVVAVLDDDAITEVPPPVYFSGTYVMHACHMQGRSYIADKAEMIGLSVTKDPGTVAAKPIQWRAGDIRRAVDRGSWPIGWRANDLLAAAVDWLETFPRHGAHERVAKHLVDRRPRWWEQLSTHERMRLAAARENPLPDGIRRSGHLGRVISVS